MRKKLLGGVALLLLAGVVWLNYFSLREAYGSGPPYYGRSTNMDKWSDPLPALVALDSAAVVALGGLFWWARRSRNAQRTGRDKSH